MATVWGVNPIFPIYEIVTSISKLNSSRHINPSNCQLIVYFDQLLGAARTWKLVEPIWLAMTSLVESLRQYTLLYEDEQKWERNKSMETTTVLVIICLFRSDAQYDRLESSDFNGEQRRVVLEHVSQFWGAEQETKNNMQSGLEIRTWNTERHPITELFKSR